MAASMACMSRGEVCMSGGRFLQFPPYPDIPPPPDSTVLGWPQALGHEGCPQRSHPQMAGDPEVTLSTVYACTERSIILLCYHYCVGQWMA
eukprot:scaffold20783_cov26-Tisochrysis_lutea.AAC.1